MKLPTSMCSGAIDHSPELLDAADPEEVRLDPVDLRSQRDEEAAEVLDVRFAGGVRDRRLTRRQDGGHQGVLGRHHARLVEEDVGAAQAVGLHLVAGVELDRRTEALEGMDVRIEPSPSDHVATRRRHARPAEARQQRPCEQERRADSLREHGVDLIRRESLRIDANLVRSGPLRVRTRDAHELEHGLDVADPRDVRERYRLVREQAGGEDR